MKGFILGVAVGGAAVLIWSHFKADGEPKSAEPRLVAAQPQQARLPQPQIATVSDTKCPVAAPPSPAVHAQAEVAETVEPAVAGLPVDSYERQWGMTDALKRQADTLSEQQSQALCSYIHRSRAAREEAKLSAEPRDESWAPPMEQLIAQHINSALKGLALDELKIVCRTTFCDINARGATANGTQEKFGTASQSIRDQPWSEFSGFNGIGGGSDGSRWHGKARLMRGSAEQLRMLREFREAQERQQQTR